MVGRIAGGLCVALLLPALAGAAGVVTVEQSGDRVVVRGDDAGNALTIAGEAAGALVVRGIEGTRVGDGDAVTLAGVRSLAVRLDGGDDLLRLERFFLRGRVAVRLDRGADVLVLEDVGARRGIIGRTGPQPDEVTVLRRLRGGGRVLLLTGDGSDRVDVADATLGARLAIVTGRHDDVVLVSQVWARRDLDVYGQTDEDQVILSDLLVEDDLRVRLGEDDDRLWIDDLSVDDDAVLAGDEDHDQLVPRGFFDVDGLLSVQGFQDID
jgi:hypothetical protein